MRKLVLTLMISFLTFSNAYAKPKEIDGYIEASEPLGEGKLKWLFWEVYEASLWSDKEWSYSTPFALSLEYLRDISKQDLIDRSIKEIRDIDGLSEEKLSEIRIILDRVFPSVKTGDRITALYLVDKTIFFHNGKTMGEVTENYFHKPFFNIWLSEKTVAADLRKILLNIDECEDTKTKSC